MFWWMELDLVSLKGGACPSCEFWGVYVFGMLGMALAAGLLMCSIVFLFLKALLWGIQALSLLVLGWWAWLWCGDGGLWEELSPINVLWCHHLSGEQSLETGLPPQVQTLPSVV